MALTNNNLKAGSGFTIVELLIVIVVIAILATISIVAYSGIQQKAKTTKAQTNASQVQKIAEAYYADKNVYPTATANFTAADNVAKLPSSITLPLGATLATLPTLNASNGETAVMYRYVGTAPDATGACVFFWDFGTKALSTTIIYMGDATSSNCSGTVGATGNSLTA